MAVDINGNEIISVGVQSPSTSISVGANVLYGPQGINGKDVYELWQEEGNTGTFADFLLTLKGEKGSDGEITSEELETALLAKADKSTTYNKSEVDGLISSIPTPDVSGQISTHNLSDTAHSDIRTALNNKVDKVIGKSLVSDSEITRLAGVFNVDISGKVDKVAGKSLSTEDYTTAEKNKLAGIEAGAEVNPDLTPYALKSEIPDITIKADKSTTYTKTEVDGLIEAIPTPDVSGQINTHNLSEVSHADIRQIISTLLGSISGINTGDQNASSLSVSTTNFNNNLSSADNTVQKALETLDELTELQNRLYCPPRRIATGRRVSDLFTFDLSLFDKPAYGLSTFAISNGRLYLKAGGSFHLSTVKSKMHEFYDCIARSTISAFNTTMPQIHLRATDANNVLVFTIDPTNGRPSLYVRVGGALTTYSTAPVVDGFTTSTPWELVAKLWQHRASVEVHKNGLCYSAFDLTDLALLNAIGSTIGVGGNSTTVNTYYDNLNLDELKGFINIVCLGDSLTAGNNIVEQYKYPNRLKGYYKDKPVGVINKGVSGDTTSRIDSRLVTDLVSHRISNATANICLLLIGTNNIGATTPESPEVVYPKISDLCAKIRAYGYEPWIITIPPRVDSYHANVKILNQMLRDNPLGDKLIDFYAECVDENGSIIDGLLQGDGLHLTADCYNILSGLIKLEIYNEFGV